MNEKEEQSKDVEQIDKLYQAMVNTTEYNNMLSVLLPLIEVIKTSDVVKQLLKPSASSLKERFEKSGRRMLLFKEDSKAPATTEILTLRKAFVFLGLFETSITNLIDLILMIFILNGHDFYVYSSRKYAKSVDDFETAPLYEKLVFLDHHGLQVFSNYINRNLRNKVAHLDFDIKTNREISIKGDSYNLEDEIVKLMAFTLLVLKVLDDSGMPRVLADLSQN